MDRNKPFLKGEIADALDNQSMNGLDAEEYGWIDEAGALRIRELERALSQAMGHVQDPKAREWIAKVLDPQVPAGAQPRGGD